MSMKKPGFLTFLTCLVVLTPVASGAAYPVYQNGNVVSSQNPVVYLPSNGNVPVVANSAVAARPTRVTGALPRVGTAATTAGRQYYQPADYDRLADSGLYIGFSAAYTVGLYGHMSADYANEMYSFEAPGAFQDADFKSDTIIPLQASVGAAVNSDLRIDFSYLRYSGLSYPDSVQTDDGGGGFVGTRNSGGAITTNSVMLNVYYNIDSFTGYVAGGSLRPYVGLGVGMSFNTIADYVVVDESSYPVEDPSDPLHIFEENISAYHNGGTTEQLAFMFEGGVTTSLSGGLSLDLFARYANLGKVKTSGSIVVARTEVYDDGMGGEIPYDETFQLTDWQESGRIGMFDIGARLRLQF